MNRTEALHILGLEDDATADDIKIAYRETVQILHLAQQFKARGCSLIAITSSPQSTLAKMADMTLPYYTTARRVGSEKYDLTSQMPALYLLEALAHRVYNRLLE